MELQSILQRLQSIEKGSSLEEAKFQKSGVRATDKKKGKVEKTTRKSYFCKLEKDGATKGVTVVADEGESQEDVRSRVNRDHKSGGWRCVSIREKEAVEESVHIKTDVEEDDIGEGNRFSNNLMKARMAGKKEADLDGDGDLEPVKPGKVVQEYDETNEGYGEEKVDEGDYAADTMFQYRQGQDRGEERDIMGMDSDSEVKECGPVMGGMDSGMGQPSTMNVTTSSSSEGEKSITISATGDEAEELMHILKLSGLGKTRSDGMEEEMSEADNAQFANAPETSVQPLEAQLDQGTDLHRKKNQYSDFPGGDNRMSPRPNQPTVGISNESQKELADLERRLFEELESIKIYEAKKKSS